MMNAFGVGRTLFVVSVLLSLVLLAACMPVQPTTGVSAQPATEDMDAVADAIWDEYASTLMAGDTERWIELWVEDSMKMPPDEPIVEGRDALKAYMDGLLAAFAMTDFEITNLEVQAADDLAFSRGVFQVTLTPKAGGEGMHMDGKFLDILQKQPDGSWKLYIDSFNSNVPPVPVAAPTTDVEEVAAAVDAIWREYEASLLDGDVDRWIAQWMEDGVQMPPNTPPRVGSATIYTAVSGFLSEYEYTEFAIVNEDVEVNGDLAFARGNYTGTFVAKSGGDPVTIEGKYMTILRQQPDGSWKIYRDIFNSNVP